MNAMLMRLTPQQQQALAEAAEWHVELTTESNIHTTLQEWRSWLLLQYENQWAWQQLENLQRQLIQLPGELAFESLKPTAEELESNNHAT